MDRRWTVNPMESCLGGATRTTHQDEPAGFDAVDFGVELETIDGEIWSLTWDPPGEHEGIGIRREPLIGSYADGLTAVWEATSSSLWADVGPTPRWR